MLFTLADAHQLSGNWDINLSGFLSVLDLETGQWRNFDTYRNLGTDELFEMIGQQGEILVTSNRGAHRYRAADDTWQFLDSGCVLKNSEFHAGAATADELWLGYARQRFGVLGRQGISRFSEKIGQWTYISPSELGTGSPVRRIVTLDNGEIWVLFGPEPYVGAAAMPHSYYANERQPQPTGLGCWSQGKWSFPAVQTPDSTAQPPGLARPSVSFDASDDMAAVGNQLVYFCRDAVFVGPTPWSALPRAKSSASGQPTTAKVWRLYVGSSPFGRRMK